MQPRPGIIKIVNWPNAFKMLEFSAFDFIRDSLVCDDMSYLQKRKLLHLLILFFVISGINLSTISDARSHGVSELLVASDAHAHDDVLGHSHSQLAEESPLHDASSHFHDTPTQLVIASPLLVSLSEGVFSAASRFSPLRHPDPFERPPRPGSHS